MSQPTYDLLSQISRMSPQLYWKGSRDKLKFKACSKTEVMTSWFLDTRFCMKFVLASVMLIDYVVMGFKGFQKQPKVHQNPVHISWYTRFKRDVKWLCSILFIQALTGANTSENLTFSSKTNTVLYEKTRENVGNS